MQQFCPELPVIENGEVLPNQNPPFPLNGSVRFKCNIGFNSNSYKIDCVSSDNGPRWTNGICVGKSCGDPGFVENATQEGSVFTFPNSVRYRCDFGYAMTKGNKTKIAEFVTYCNANGHWSGDVKNIRCERVRCPDLSNPPNGKIGHYDPFVGSDAVYECNSGFRLTGNATRTCQNDGTWSGDEPVCSQTFCKNPGPFKNGKISPDKLFYEPDAIVFFDCRGTISISKCLPTGLWTQEPPYCPPLNNPPKKEDDPPTNLPADPPTNSPADSPTDSSADLPTNSPADSPTNSSGQQDRKKQNKEIGASILTVNKRYAINIFYILICFVIIFFILGLIIFYV